MKMKKLFTIFAVSAVCFSVSSCATIDASSSALQATATQYAIPLTEIIHQKPARFAATVPGSRYARFQLGIYIQTTSQLILLSYSNDTKEFTKVLSLPIVEINSASIESWGMFNHLKQLQLTSRDTLIAVNFSNSSDAMAGSIESTKPAYDLLIQAGIQQGTPQGRVLPQEVRNYVTPIIIPAR